MVGLEHGGTGAWWDWSMVGLEHGLTEAWWDYSMVGLEHGGTGAYWDWSMLGLEHAVVKLEHAGSSLTGCHRLPHSLAAACWAHSMVYNGNIVTA